MNTWNMQFTWLQWSFVQLSAIMSNKELLVIPFKKNLNGKSQVLAEDKQPADTRQMVKLIFLYN